MKSEALTVPRDGVRAVPIADLRDVPLEQLAADADVRGMVSGMLGDAADEPRMRGTMFSSAI